MVRPSIALAALATLVPYVLGHGQVRRIITETNTYIADDAYSTVVTASSPIRKLNEVGPAVPFTGPNITCGPGGNKPVANSAPVRAGSKVTFDWNSWGSDHKGPIMTYVARCPNGCSTFKGDSGNVWIKIDHDGYDPNRTPKWAEEKLHSPGTYTVTIPGALQNGEYLLRHEVLGLHVAGTANGAQFYPTCIQITVSGGGSSLPTGIALPGAYQPNDPGILVDLWKISPTTPSYQIPGGPVLLSGSGGGTGGGTSVRPASTSARATTTAAGPAQTAYGQCGGQGWTGLTTCVSGYKCNAQSQYYSQCIPN